jgi:hypothetical protein
MTRETVVTYAGLALAMASTGFALGLVYFVALRKSVALFVRGTCWWGASALTIGRVGAAIVFLTLAAKLGAATLLAAFAGFLLARSVALRSAR